MMQRLCDTADLLLPVLINYRAMGDEVEEFVLVKGVYLVISCLVLVQLHKHKQLLFCL